MARGCPSRSGSVAEKPENFVQSTQRAAAAATAARQLHFLNCTGAGFLVIKAHP